MTRFEHFCRNADRYALSFVTAVSALYLLPYLRIGWIPHDEGTIAHPAERVLLGELPHRDFIDVYTGGLAFLHALAFRLFDTTLMAPRIVLLLVAVGWIAVVYLIARRFVRTLAATGVTLLALVWSLPNYFVALPSWYNLFFATFFAAALLSFSEKGNRLYLALAGVFAGLSILAKISGIYLVAAGLLFVAYLEADSDPGSAAHEGQAWRWFSLLLSLGLAALVAAVLLTIRSQLQAAQLFNFLLPAAFSAAFIGWLEWRAPDREPFAARMWSFVRNLIPFLTGVAVPLALFSIPFALAGGFVDLVRGVFVLPFQRLTEAALPPLSLWLTVPALGLAIGVLRGIDRIHRPMAIVVGCVLFLLPLLNSSIPILVVSAAQASVPLVVGAGIWVLARRREDSAVTRPRQRQVAAMLFLLAVCTLIQFPYAYRIYFLYVAPLTILAATAAFSLWLRPPRIAPAGLLVFTLIFGGVWVNHGSGLSTGFHYTPGTNTSTIPLERAGGLRVSAVDSAVYGRLIALLHKHGSSGYTYVGPDSPHAYFLSGLRNPTPHLFEFFVDAAERERQLLAALDSLDVSVIALNRYPPFSPPHSPILVAELEGRFPTADTVGPYTVRWRGR